MGWLRNVLIGKPKPANDGLIGCWNCGQRRQSDGWTCPFCRASFAALAACYNCGWRHGVKTAPYYTFTCQGCGEPCSSLAESKVERWRANVEYWLAEGYSREEAENIVREEMRNGNNLG